MGYRLGVDLGTTYTAAAIDDGSGPAMVGLGNRALTVPSAVYLSADGSFLFGEAAARRASREPGRTALEFKRRVGDTVPILLAGQPFSPQALSAKLLAWVVAVATERQGQPPDDVVVTYPANWGGYKRELLDQIVTLADVPSPFRCTEPEAAAVQYATRAAMSAGDKVVVYDLGGGTFDACVLERQQAGFAIIGSPDGVEHLGGMDFDAAVFQHVVKNMLSDRLASLDPDDPHLVASMAKLRRECVEAKEALSSDVDTSISVDLAGDSTSVRMTRSELEDLIASPLRDTLDATLRALRSANVPASELTAVVLIGGSSRIPLVSHLLHDELGVRTAMDTHPKHDVALGAVRYRSPETGEPAPPASASVTQWPTRARPPADEVPAPTTAAAPLQPPRETHPGAPEWSPPAPPSQRPQPRMRPAAAYYALAAVLAVLGVLAALLLSEQPSDPELAWSADDNLGNATAVAPGTTATTSVLGIPLPGELTIRRNGRFVVPQNTALFAAGPVDAGVEGTRVGTLARSPEDPWWRPIATVPGGFMVLALLFATAYTESQVRALRRRSGGPRFGDLAAMTVIGGTFGLACGLLAWTSGRTLEWQVLIATVVCLASAFGMLAFALATGRRRQASQRT